MRSSAVSVRAINKALRRFRRNRRGSAAIEFALVAPLFFVLLFAVIETALVFFAPRCWRTARRIRRACADPSGAGRRHDASQFSQDLCNRVKLLFTARHQLERARRHRQGLQARRRDSAPTSPIRSSRRVHGKPVYEGRARRHVLVRTFYQWPLFVTQLGYNIANLSSGRATSGCGLVLCLPCGAP